MPVRFGARLADPRLQRPAFLFAHPDDAVLSAFQAMVQAATSALDVVVCAGRPMSPEPGQWDRNSGFLGSAQARSARLGEHRGACEEIGVRSVSLDVLDGQYGGSSGEVWA